MFHSQAQVVVHSGFEDGPTKLSMLNLRSLFWIGIPFTRSLGTSFCHGSAKVVSEDFGFGGPLVDFGDWFWR